MQQSDSSSTAPIHSRLPEPVVWGVGSSLVVATVFIVVLSIQPGAFAPARPGDGPDYDNIAFNLARNRGFGLDFTDPEFLQPYQRSNHGGRFDYLFDRDDAYRPTTLRPPALPWLLSMIYRTVGRNYFIVRVVQILMAAVAIGLAVAVAAHLGGAVAANLVLILAILDSLARTDSTLIGYCFDLLTEPLAQLLLMGLVCLLMWLERRPSFARSMATGIVLGMLILSRSVFVLWIPFIFVWIIAIGVSAYRRESTKVRPAWLAMGLFIGSTLVVTPWWVRNCLILQGFMPLGTHGWVSLLGGYCDEAVQANGNWSAAPVNRCWVAISEQPWFAEIESAAIRDREFALACRRRTIDWIQNNPRTVVRLFFRRLTTHWFPYRGKVLLLSLGSLLGLILTWSLPPRHSAAVLLTYVLLVNSILVMVTYSTGGRFLVPLYPMLYLLAALGTSRVILRGVSRLTASRAT